MTQRMALEWGREWARFWGRDRPHVQRFLWGWVDGDGRHPGQDLQGAYEAWLRAAQQLDADPRAARAVMEMCRQRMAACPGGAEVLRLYDEYRQAGKRPKTPTQVWRRAVAAMRRAWRDSEPARQMPEYARAHEGTPQRARLDAGQVDGRLPVHAGYRGHSRSDPSVAAAEAAHLLGFPEVTLPQLQQFQHQHGETAGRDGETLARQWLEHMRRSGLIDQPQHDAWRDVVASARHSQQHTHWRVERGLDPAPARDVSYEPGVRREAQPRRGEAATADHLAGHAGQHHRTTDRKLGRAVDDPRTAHVDEQHLYRQQANTERGLAERYDGQATLVEPDHAMATRLAAARPSPATLARANAPADLASKRPSPVIAARPSPSPRPNPRRRPR